MQKANHSNHNALNHNGNYLKGRRYEYKIRESLFRQGYPVVLRTAGSHGPFDLVAINPDKREILLVQCKTGSNAEGEREKCKGLQEKFQGHYDVAVAVV